MCFIDDCHECNKNTYTLYVYTCAFLPYWMVTAPLFVLILHVLVMMKVVSQYMHNKPEIVTGTGSTETSEQLPNE